jgi:hypothetical protein
VTTSHFRFFAIVCGLLFSAAASYRVWQLYSQPVANKWTQAIYAPGLETTADKFEVLVAGVPLAKAIASEQLAMSKNGVLVPVKDADVKVRTNNEVALRAATLPTMIGFAAVAGGGLVLLLIGLFTPLIGIFRQHGLVDIHLTA